MPRVDGREVSEEGFGRVEWAPRRRLQIVNGGAPGPYVATPDEVRAQLTEWRRLRAEVRRLRRQAWTYFAAAGICLGLTVLGMLWIADVCLRQLAQ